MLDDYELLYLAKEGNEEAINKLLKKYTGLVHHKAIKYATSQCDIDDFINEGLLCLHEAIYNYLDIGNSKFIKYLNTCLERKMINLRKTLTRKKFYILNNSISLDKVDISLDKYLFNDNYNPDSILLDKEEYKFLKKRIIKKLNSNEELVFILREQNFSVKEISKIIDIKISEVYNMIKKIRTKIIKIM